MLDADMQSCNWDQQVVGMQGHGTWVRHSNIQLPLQCSVPGGGSKSRPTLPKSKLQEHSLRFGSACEHGPGANITR